MPELPEVETIRQDLVKKILNKKIVRVVVYVKKSVGGESTKFTQALEGNKISKLERRGKLLIWKLKRPHPALPTGQAGSPARGGDYLLVHLKMTGQLIYVKMSFPRRRESRIGFSGSPIKSGMTVVTGGHKLSESDIENLPNKFTRVAFVFADGGELFFNDQRLFGYMKLTSEGAVVKALQKFGPEPLSPHPLSFPQRGKEVTSPLPLGEGRKVRDVRFTFDYFASLFAKRKKTTVKALLLNQELIAGLGNIYVDEVCFCAGVRPHRRVGTVTKAEQKKVFYCIPKILKEALKHRGTTFRNFLDSSGKKGNYTDFLRVYDRDGEPCRRCKTIIQKTRVAGRGTHYCPVCQR